MTVVSTKEFNTHQEKYFDLAKNNEQVFIQGGDCMFIVSRANESTGKYKEPDADLRRAIPMEQVRDSVIAYIRKKHAKEV